MLDNRLLIATYISKRFVSSLTTAFTSPVIAMPLRKPAEQVLRRIESEVVELKVVRVIR